MGIKHVLVAVVLALVAGCGSTSPSAAPLSSSPAAASVAVSAYPAGWSAGFCAAYGPLATKPVEITNIEKGRAQITAALLELSKVPDWPAGNKVRDTLITYYNKESAAIDLEEQGDFTGGVDVSLGAMTDLGVVGGNIDALVAATGEALPCHQLASPRPS